MTSQEKKVIFTAIGILVVILLIVVGVKSFGGPKDNTQNKETNNTTVNEEKYTTELTDGTKINNSEDMKNTKKYKELEISNIQFTSKNGSSVLLADVKNAGTTNFTAEEVKVVLIGENGEIIREIGAYIPSIAAGESKEINSIVTAEVVSNVKDFRIEAK